MDPRKNLRELDYDETRALTGALGLEPFRADQIFRWVHGRAVDSVEV